MPQTPHGFELFVDFDPAGDLEAFLVDIPAKWAVYLMSDEHDRPVQLLCVRNLRASLKRRLGGQEQVGPTRKVPYRDVIRRVHWTRVDSGLESDWQYYLAARRLFAESFRGMVGFQPAWFVHVDPEAKFPRFTRTTDLTPRPGVLLGPLEDKHAAARLIALAEDAFDLCRYWNLLSQSPDAKACAYKEMGKCPAPCDGSISLEAYRQMVAWSVSAITEPAAESAAAESRMRQAASELRFETAGRIKQVLTQLSQLGQGAFRHVSPFGGMSFLAVMKGPRSRQCKLFLVGPGWMEPVLGLIGEPTSDLISVLREAARNKARQAPDPLDAADVVGIVSQHLFAAKTSPGVLLRMSTLDLPTLARCFRDLRKPAAEPAPEDEGVLKELADV